MATAHSQDLCRGDLARRPVPAANIWEALSPGTDRPLSVQLKVAPSPSLPCSLAWLPPSLCPQLRPSLEIPPGKLQTRPTSDLLLTRACFGQSQPRPHFQVLTGHSCVTGVGTVHPMCSRPPAETGTKGTRSHRL